MSDAPTFDEWVIIELLGHRRLAGHLTEQQIGGAGFLRLDVPGDGTNVATQFYAPGSVYCITPVTEDVARKVAAGNRPEPATRWELNPGGPGPFDTHDDDDEWGGQG